MARVCDSWLFFKSFFPISFLWSYGFCKKGLAAPTYRFFTLSGFFTTSAPLYNCRVSSGAKTHKTSHITHSGKFLESKFMHLQSTGVEYISCSSNNDQPIFLTWNHRNVYISQLRFFLSEQQRWSNGLLERSHLHPPNTSSYLTDCSRWLPMTPKASFITVSKATCPFHGTGIVPDLYYLQIGNISSDCVHLTCLLNRVLLWNPIPQCHSVFFQQQKCFSILQSILLLTHNLQQTTGFFACLTETNSKRRTALPQTRSFSFLAGSQTQPT